MSNFTWDKDANGDLILDYYDGHQTATLTGEDCVLGLSYADHRDVFGKALSSLQLVMSRDQARTIGEHLLRLADAPHIPKPSSDLKH